MKLRLCLQPLPIANITARAPPLVRAAAALDSPGSKNPAVLCVYEGFGLHVPYENHPETTSAPPLQKENCLPRKWSLVPKRLLTAYLEFVSVK